MFLAREATFWVRIMGQNILSAKNSLKKIVSSVEIVLFKKKSTNVGRSGVGTLTIVDSPDSPDARIPKKS